MLFKFLTIASLASVGFAAQATTTNYHDGFTGACGCGAALNSYTYTAAGSAAIFGSGTWCGSGCGSCYTLTSTGTAPSGQGSGGGAGKSIVVMVTNLCPYSGNERWCPASGSNSYGYSAHFDIDNASGGGGFGSLGWNNPIVNYSPTACPGSTSSLYRSACQCGGGSGGSSPTTTTRTTTTTQGSSGGGSGTAAHYAQCGGTGWTGPTTCASPYTCKVSSQYYSQCL